MVPGEESSNTSGNRLSVLRGIFSHAYNFMRGLPWTKAVREGKEDKKIKTGHESRSSGLLGFFLQPHQIYYENLSACGLNAMPSSLFVPTSDEGKELEKGKWGSLDASLSFLEQEAIYIVGSSNGFLLCRTSPWDNKHHIVCNPVTREWRFLPEACRECKYVAMAFVCKGNSRALNEVYYEVIRARVSNPMKLSTTLEIETFSSATGAWTESSLTCSSPFTLVICNLPAFVFNEVIHWRDPRCCLVAYDPAKARVELMELPGASQNFFCYSDHFGESEGMIHHARVDHRYLEIFVLKVYEKAEWIMKHRVSLVTIIEQNPTLGIPIDRVDELSMGIRSFHPGNSQQIMVTLYGNPFWYNFESKILSSFGDFRSRRKIYRYFKY